MAYPSHAPFGLILAGGQARRMGGGDKPLLRLGTGTLLSAVIERIAPQCGTLAISAPDDGERFHPYGLWVIPDTLAGFRGPLAGVLAGLDALAAHGHGDDWLLTVPGDTPFLPMDLVERLDEARRTAGVLIACAATGGRAHPVVALWSSRVRTPLDEALRGRDRRGVDAFQRDVGRVVAAWPDVSRDPFFNVNTPDDLADAERLLSGTGP